MPSLANNHWTPCPYCGYKWPRKLDITYSVMLPTATLETTVSCPCRKSCIVLRLKVTSTKFVDVEAYKHWGKTPEES